MEISLNIKKIREEIAKVCFVDDICIVAATKNIDIAEIKQLKNYQIENCGENKVQELMDKVNEVNTNWHFIGRLQTNKVKYIVGKVVLIQSVDSFKLMEEINKIAKLKNIIQKVLVQVNIGNEPQKGGVEKNTVIEFIKQCEKYNNIEINGLMATMPIVKDENTNYYLQMKELYDIIKSNIKTANCNFSYLSMGMSNDYVNAIKYGANMIRLGSAIFK